MGQGLEVRDLRVEVGGRPVVEGVTLSLRPGERHALLGPAGAGKSTLARAIMGDPRCEVTAGEILLDGEDIRALLPAARARRGLFLAFQDPAEIAGVTTTNFLRQAANAVRAEPVGVFEMQGEVKGALARLGADPKLARRSLNEGLARAEKKQGEILQLGLLKPRLAILDEPEVPLATLLALGRPDMAVLALGRDARLLSYIPAAFVHIMEHGRLVMTGGPEIAAGPRT